MSYVLYVMSERWERESGGGRQDALKNKNILDKMVEGYDKATNTT